MSGTASYFGTDQSASFPTGPLAEGERADVRRFCGYSVRGPVPDTFSDWRFFQFSGLLEYRMTNLTPVELQRCRMILAVLQNMEAAVWGAGANLDTDVASVWTHNKNEVGDRRALYVQTRIDLCEYMKVPYLDGGTGGGRRVI